MSNMVQNPEDRFSRDTNQIVINQSYFAVCVPGFFQIFAAQETEILNEAEERQLQGD